MDKLLLQITLLELVVSFQNSPLPGISQYITLCLGNVYISFILSKFPGLSSSVMKLQSPFHCYDDNNNTNNENFDYALKYNCRPRLVR